MKRGWIIGSVAVSSVIIFSVFFMLNQHEEISTTETLPIKIGIATWISDEEYEKNVAGFKTGLEEKGLIDGLQFEYIIKNAEGDHIKQRQIIQGFLNERVDLIYTLTTPGTIIVKELSKETPVVFSIVTYPVKAKLIDNFENSGNNLVGTSNHVSIEEQLLFFSKIYPFKKIGFVHSDQPNSNIQLKNMKKPAIDLGIEVIDIRINSIDYANSVITNAIKDVDALYQACDTVIQGGVEEIAIEVARQNKKPTFSCNREGVNHGALAGLVIDFEEIGKKSGHKAALILKGSLPQELKSEYSKPISIINANTVNDFRLEIPKIIWDSSIIV